MTSDDKPDWDALRAEAAGWLAGLDCGTADRAEFEAWRAADPKRAVAFAQIANVTRTLDRVKPTYKMLQEDEDAALVATTSDQPERPNRRRFMTAAFGAGGVALAGGAAALFASERRATIVTAIGGRRAEMLPGGGHMEVNTDSRVQWRGENGTVKVWLRQGEVLLDLVHATQPCLLHAGGKTALIALSKVNARLRGDLLDLAVVSGNCTLQSNTANATTTGSGRSAVIQANQAVIAGPRTQILRPLDAAERDFLAAWPDGELAFQGQTLGTAVTEYNRYLTRKIVIADPSLADIRLGGRFTSHDPTVFLAALHAGFGINAVDDGLNTIALTK